MLSFNDQFNVEQHVDKALQVSRVGIAAGVESPGVQAAMPFEERCEGHGTEAA